MRVLHLVSEPGPPGRGVPQKVARTVEVWRTLGVEADHLDVATGRLGFDGVASPALENPGPVRRAGWVREMERRGRRLLQVLDRERPDIVYTRELVWAPAIESIFRRHRVVVEINSDRAMELRPASRAAAAFWRLTAGRLLRRAAGVVAVTDELLGRLAPEGLSGCVIPNATSVPRVRPRSSPRLGRPMAVMLVGCAAPWHGLDRFSLLADALPHVEFVVCGDLRDSSSSVSASVRRVPSQTGDALEALFRQATVGVGSLAISRNGMTQACPLKSRSCLAAGLPIVYGYEDPAIQDAVDFALRLSEEDWRTGGAIRSVDRFVEVARADPSLGMKAWRFARSQMDVEVVERRRLSFLAEVAGSNFQPRRTEVTETGV